MSPNIFSGTDIISGGLTGGLPQVGRFWPTFPYRPPDQIYRRGPYKSPPIIDFGQENRQVADPNAAFIPPTPSSGLKALMDAYRAMGALKSPEPAPGIMLPKMSPWSLLGLGVIGALDPTKTVVPGFAQGLFQGGQMSAANENLRRQNEADAAERAARAQLGMAQVQYEEEQQRQAAAAQAEAQARAQAWKEREFERLTQNDFYQRLQDAEKARIAAENTDYLRSRAVIEDQAKATAGVTSAREAAIDNYRQDIDNRFRDKQGPWTQADVDEFNQKRRALKDRFGEDIGHDLTPVPRVGATSVASGNLAARESDSAFNRQMREKEYGLSERRLTLEERKAADTVVKENPDVKKLRGELESYQRQLAAKKEQAKTTMSLGLDKEIAALESKVRVWAEALRRKESPTTKQPPAMKGTLPKSGGPTLGPDGVWR